MAAAPLGTGVEVEGESLESFMGVSSLAASDVGSMRARSLSGATLRVMTLEVVEAALVEDLRRSFAGVDLLDGAIVCRVGGVEEIRPSKNGGCWGDFKVRAEKGEAVKEKGWRAGNQARGPAR